MNNLDLIALAWRNLGQAKLRTAFTQIGVIIGVAAIITLVSFGIGLRHNILTNALAKLDTFASILVFEASTRDMMANRDLDLYDVK